jgi:hypothetical protein
MLVRGGFFCWTRDLPPQQSNTFLNRCSSIKETNDFIMVRHLHNART